MRSIIHYFSVRACLLLIQLLPLSLSFVPIFSARQRRHPLQTQTHSHLYNSNNKNNKNQNDKDDTTSIWTRFTSPRIDDPRLPLVDASVAQIVAPSLEIAWLTLAHAPAPSWLRPIPGGTLVAPTLVHGAALASCWMIGALAARAYERDALAPQRNDSLFDYSILITRILQAGACSIGILILMTQLDLLLEFGRWVQPGESQDKDFRLLTAAVEVTNDCVFEAIALGSWRLFLASRNAKHVE
jgi:hypothetical protein